MQSYPKTKDHGTLECRGRFSSVWIGAFIFGLLLTNCSAWLQNSPDSKVRGREALRSGGYAAARRHFEAALKSGSDLEDCQTGLLQTLRVTGAYREAATLAGQFLAARAGSAALHLENGRIDVETGDYEGAQRHFRRALVLAGNSVLKLEAMKELAGLLEEIGQRADSNSLWDELIREYRSGHFSGSRAMGIMAVAAWRRGYVQDAKDFFIDATDGKAGGEISLESLSDFGYLFLEKYNAKEAIGVFRDCLQINKAYPPALIGLAQARRYDGSAEAEAFARTALEVNPNFVPAMTLLTELRMEEEDYASALKEIRRALAVNPSNLDALSLEGVCQHFLGNMEAFSAAERKVLGINPGYGRFYYILAENLVMRRKYREAVEQNRGAIRLDPELWSAYSSLGINLMRSGDLAGGRSALQQAFKKDPFNIWAYNTLDLLDQMDKFVRSRSEHFVFIMAREDEASLSSYAPKLAEEAYQQLTRRYGFTPEGPLQVEVYPDHGGFAVRTLGLPGLGALGVCFGKVVALDSPRARKIGSFNWGSTLWHELAHVITLQMTKHNIPRWYSEGLSVYEEHRARPGWGDDLTPAIVKAYKEGRLLKVSELNAGMMRPKTPEQIGLSYYQAGLFCELIEGRFGFEKIKQSLNLLAENKPSDSVFQTVLGWDKPTLDKEYGAFLDAQLRGVASHLDFTDPRRHGNAATDRNALMAAVDKNPDDFFANLRFGALLREEKVNREAEIYLKRAEKLFPEYVGPDSHYQILSEIYLEEKREEEELQQLVAWTRYDETAIAPLIRAAEIYRGRKNWSAAARMLELSMYIQPYDPRAISLLGESAGEAGDWAAAVAAYQVLTGSNPPDPAGAHYDLARAWLGLGRNREAKRETLRALEIAPTFDKAQQLLIKLSGAQP